MKIEKDGMILEFINQNHTEAFLLNGWKVLSEIKENVLEVPLNVSEGQPKKKGRPRKER